jgi:hypothetical protein
MTNTPEHKKPKMDRVPEQAVRARTKSVDTTAVIERGYDVTEENLLKSLKKKALDVYRAVYQQKDMSGLKLRITLSDIRGFNYEQLADITRENSPFGSVIVNSEDAAVMQVHMDYLYRMNMDDWSGTSIAAVCLYLQESYHDTYFFPSLSFLSVIQAHRDLFRALMKGSRGILFPGILFAIRTGQWCVPVVQFKDNQVDISLIPITRRLGGYEVFLIEKH